MKKTLFSQRLKLLEELDKRELDVPKLRKGDYVRIRQIQPVGHLKKFWRPWSSEIYQVMDVLAYSKTALLDRVDPSPRVRRVKLRCPLRLIKKIVRKVDLIKALQGSQQAENQTSTGNEEVDIDDVRKSDETTKRKMATQAASSEKPTQTLTDTSEVTKIENDATPFKTISMQYSTPTYTSEVKNVYFNATPSFTFGLSSNFWGKTNL